MKLVTVVVLSYFSADTILQTLDSIKAQTYKNIELIVADDCSKDNSVQIAQDWIVQNREQFYAAMVVTAPANGGIPSNINRALRSASGEYLKLIGADDYMEPSAIEEYVCFCEKNPNAIPIAKAKLFGGGEACTEPVQKYCNSCYDFAQKDYKEQYRMLLVKNRIVAPSSSFYPMGLIRALGGYDERYHWFEDYPMNLRVMHRGYRYGLIDRELVYYRISDKSITASSLSRLKKSEAGLFFNLRLWYMLQNKMFWEALGQSRYWIKILLKKG